MVKRFSKLLVMAVATCWLVAPVRAQDVTDADDALAARVSDFGTDLLRRRDVSPAYYRACVAMLKAAGKLNSNDPRYPRLLIEACLGNRDVDGAIDGLKTYRQLAPDDQGAQLQLIELNMSKMESLDAKLAYTNQILGADRVNSDVRSAVAVTAARLMIERSQSEQASAMLDQAIRLNPSNGEALRLRYQQFSPNMSPFQKVRVLIQMIKSNPLQPAAVAELAKQLADMGLVKPSLEWHYNAIKLYQQTGQAVPLDLALDYAAEQFLADRFDGADGMAIQLLGMDPNDVDAIYLRLMCARNTPLDDDDRTARNLARKTLLARLTEARDEVLNPTTRPATRPSTAPASMPAAGAGTEEPRTTIDPETGLPRITRRDADVELSAKVLPDLSAALAKIDPAGESPDQEWFATTIADLAWYVLFFDPNPEVSDPLIQALAKIAPADHVTLVRLQGWNFLTQNKHAEAKTKLEAVADRDSMAAVGLIKLTPPTDAEANTKGRKLLSENPSGMSGAFIKEALRDRGIKVVAREEAQVIAEELEQFPSKWLSIIDDPRTFYTIIGEPLKGQFDYRQPMLIRITIQNLSGFDIPMGPTGVLRNDLWIDAQIRGTGDQPFPGTTYDRITQQLVLRVRQSVSQVVRIDQGALAKVLSDNPTQPQQVYPIVVTNPIATKSGVIAGAGGYRVMLKKPVARGGFPVTSERAIEAMLQNLVSGTAGRISNMDLMAAYIRESRRDQNDERLAKLTPLFEQKLVAVKIDPSASIRGWAMYVLAMLTPQAPRAQQVHEMSRNADWTTRLLAGVLANDLMPESRKQVLTELSGDSEPSIKEYAIAMLEGGATTPTPMTQPTITTQPVLATAPVAQPAITTQPVLATAPVTQPAITTQPVLATQPAMTTQP